MRLDYVVEAVIAHDDFERQLLRDVTSTIVAGK
jgi:hypothetical protein